MVFRLPTHLETGIPPPSEQVPQSRPWRGTLVLQGIQMADGSTIHEIRVTAVETEGDNRAEIWPPRFFVHMHRSGVRTMLHDFQLWVRRNRPPLCTFLPDVLEESEETTNNQFSFRSLTKILAENEMVAIAPWNIPGRIPGAGIIIYPGQDSTALLFGAIFLNSPFPEFLAASPMSAYLPSSQYTSPQFRQTEYQQTMEPSSSYGSVPRHTSHHPTMPQALSSHRMEHYQLPAHPYATGSSAVQGTFSNAASSSQRYVQYPAQAPNQAGPSGEHVWTMIKNEEQDMNQYPTFKGNYPQ